jgi:hypothetical protein
VLYCSPVSSSRQCESATNLATIASYFEGGVSAVVYSGTDGSTTIQMIRPPSEATKAKNAETRWADPFKFGAPGYTP